MAIGSLIQCIHIQAVNKHLSSVCVIQACNQIQDGGFSVAGFAYKSGAPSGRHMETYILQHGFLIRAVAEAHVPELNLAAHRVGKQHGSAALDILLPQNFIYADQAVIALGNLGHCVHQTLYIADNQVEYGLKQHKQPDPDMACGRQICRKAQRHQSQRLEDSVGYIIQADRLPVIRNRRFLNAAHLPQNASVFGLFKAVGAGQIRHLQHLHDSGVRLLCLPAQFRAPVQKRPGKTAKQNNSTGNNQSIE